MSDPTDPASASGGDTPGYSMPVDSPLVPRFPVAYRDVTVLTACYRSDAGAIDALLPAPLVRVSDVVMVHIYDMPDVDYFGPVHECNVMVGAALESSGRRITGGFTTALLIDSDAGLALGREVHGQPKKLGKISLQARGDLVVGTVARNGIEVIVATTPYKQRRAELSALSEHFDFADNINYKSIPQIDGTPGLAQLTARRLAGVQVHECWRAPGTLELRPNAQAPVWRLPVREPLDAFYWRADFTLVPGRVIHDYLAAGTSPT
jgi:acetoacetate decarboxylase